MFFLSKVSPTKNLQQKISYFFREIWFLKEVSPAKDLQQVMKKPGFKDYKNHVF